MNEGLLGLPGAQAGEQRLRRAYANIDNPSLGALATDSFDFVIDSDAKLTQWRNNQGTFTRVLIRAGNWTVNCSNSAPQTGAGLGINLTNTKTVFIFGEGGSSITFRALSVDSASGGFYYTSVPSTLNASITGLKIYFDGGGGNVCAFHNCTNVSGCYIANPSLISVSSFYGFRRCENVSNCSVYWRHGTAGAHSTGFDTCTYLSNCQADVQSGPTGSIGIPQAFYNCTNMINCLGTATAISGSNGASQAISGCINVLNCVANATALASQTAGAFVSCQRVVNSIGRAKSGLNNYAFLSNKKVSNCTASSAGGYATGLYNTSYADAGTVSACADTSGGGWNDISTLA